MQLNIDVLINQHHFLIPNQNNKVLQLPLLIKEVPVLQQQHQDSMLKMCKEIW